MNAPPTGYLPKKMMLSDFNTPWLAAERASDHAYLRIVGESVQLLTIDNVCLRGRPRQTLSIERPFLFSIFWGVIYVIMNIRNIMSVLDLLAKVTYEEL